MLEWQHPGFFALLLPLGILAWRSVRRHDRVAAPWSSLRGMERGWTPRLLLAPLPGFLEVLGLIALIAAMARPQKIHSEDIVSSEGSTLSWLWMCRVPWKLPTFACEVVR